MAPARVDRDPRIGTAHPVLVAATASDGGWSVLCQARRDSDGDGRISVRPTEHGALLGDELLSYLVLGSGPGVQIDELAAASADGRWLVVKRGGRLYLIDARSGSELDLSAAGADARSDAATYRDHRAVAFDPASTRLAYLKRGAGHQVIAVRELATGRESVIDPGPIESWRVGFDAGGRWLELDVVPADSNRNGRVEWPVPEVPSNTWRCQGPVPRMSVWPDHGDRIERRFVLLEDGSVHSAPGAIGPCGKGLLRRNEQEELLLEAGSELSVLASARCKARLVHADCSQDALIVACTGGKNRRPALELVGRGQRLPLGVDIAPQGSDQPSLAPEGTRFVAINSGHTPLVVDLKTRKTIALEEGDVGIASAGAHVLVRRGNRLVLLNLETQAQSVLPGELAPFGAVLQSGDTWLLEPLIVDLAGARLLGTVPGRAEALDKSGRVLLAETSAQPGQALAVGPLLWTAPLPAPAPPPATSSSGAAAQMRRMPRSAFHIP